MPDPVRPLRAEFGHRLGYDRVRYSIWSPVPLAMSIVVRTLSDRVFEAVREQILKGRLRNGEPIRQDALATALGISKIPLREALARLEQEGLLINHPNRG